MRVEDSRLTLHANVMDASGSPLDAGTVVATLVDPAGEKQTIRLKREKEGEWGLYRKGPGGADALAGPFNPARRALVALAETGTLAPRGSPGGG